ncbi:hypothetical protein CEUSTIGMA_g1285.t1 [Chlamydomonas eustigma]|uniref:Armadillo-like repeats domain-containing protein n=1 Tax=Chlamydomonas eustigma TaxID=1157962 RepID=A0A250WSN3_9CHLO|nr:hypothetical protein CEUSTIGMA_g1285.t1 [Chlamydomonas eustigma]|eukprot:GAX73835.1 hypothetical protein CEUSTIGMA_g1285.t1 [Chlamydomonas eustigma]
MRNFQIPACSASGSAFNVRRVSCLNDRHHIARKLQQVRYSPLAASSVAESERNIAGYERTPEVPSGPSDQNEVGQEEQFTEIEVSTEVEVEVEVEVKEQGFRPRVAVQEAQTFISTTNVGKGIGFAALAVLAVTLGLAVKRTYEKANTAKAQRARQIERNKKLVTELSKYLPEKRLKLSNSIVKGIKGSTGFTPSEIFRKYLWFLLRERKFDQDAVDDLVALKVAAMLSDEEVAEALAERSQRIYDKYGTMMLNTEGFTAQGLERKATCKALFQKILYLSEYEALVKQGSEAAGKINLRTIFGATEEDMDKLRLVSLHDVDLESLFKQGTVQDDDSSGEQGQLDRGGERTPPS